jgi:hypothetical protein
MRTRAHHQYHCPYGHKLKCYRYRKCIEKIIELQTRIGEHDLTYNKAMDEISNSFIKIILLEPANVQQGTPADPVPTEAQRALTPDTIYVTQDEVNRVYDEIIYHRKFFPPEHTDGQRTGNLAPDFIRMFNVTHSTIKDEIKRSIENKLEKEEDPDKISELTQELSILNEKNLTMFDLYPCEKRCKATNMPNMRQPKDVIENNLFTQIVNNEIQDPVDDLINDQTIIFKNRKFINFEIVSRQRGPTSFGKTFDQFFGKIDPESYKLEDETSSPVTYLYPDQLNELVSKGYLKYSSYIDYRNKFVDELSIKYKLVNVPISGTETSEQKLKTMFIMDNINIIKPDAAAGGGGAAGAPNVGGALGQAGGYYNKYQKYLQKYLINY